MSGNWHISRRTALKGLGTALALPWLEAMSPALGWAADAADAVAAPKRMAFLYVPNGIHMQQWTPKSEGTGYELPPILEPLRPFQDDFQVLSGLKLDKANANGDGGGDHARSLASFLTCCQARKTHGADIKVGVSVDQLAAQTVGTQTKFPSLEIGCDAGAQAGNCDSGYSCAYSSNIAWRTESTPVAKEINPKLVFERLFADPTQGPGAAGRVAHERRQKSVLDFVRDDAARLQKKLGGNDQRKLDEYLSSVRELELRIERAQRPVNLDGIADLKRPDGMPQDYQEHLRLMCDMLVLAFRTDVTRISTFVFANEGSNRSYKFIDVPDGHHDLSHHGNDEGKLAKIAKINTFHVMQLAYLVEKLKAVQEGEQSLLDNCMIVYGSGIADGNAHNHDNLPILLLGRGGGTLQTGRHVKYQREPIANLYLALLERMGVAVDKLGDSNGKLQNLAG
jgi:hypothetical protein